MNPSPKNLTRGYAIGLVGALIWSMTAIFIRYLTEEYQMPPMVLAFWRDTFISLILMGVLALLRPALLRVERRHWKYLAVYGVLLAVFNALWTTSVKLNGAAVSTVLSYSAGAFTAVLGRWLLKEHLGWVKGVAVTACLGGCVLISGAVDPTAWALNPAGIITGLISGLAFALYSLMGKVAAQNNLNPWSIVTYSFGFAAVVLLGLNFFPVNPMPSGQWEAGIPHLFWLGTRWMGWLLVFLLAAGPSIGGYGLFNVSLVYLPASIANLIATSEPVWTAILAFFVLGERMSGLQIGGSLLILGGVVFLRLFERN